MAKLFAKSFYNSSAWKRCREAYFNSQFGLCELCERPGEEVHHKTFLTPENITDPDITLNWDNLQLLCKTCHNAEHEKAYEMYRKKNRKNLTTNNDLCFDDSGNLVRKENVFIVWGAPSSGKTSYVQENKEKYDIVVDLDFIISALSLGQRRNEDAFPFALDVKELLIGMIEERKHFFEHAWIIGCLPKRKEREKLARKVNGKLIHIDTDENECIKRAKTDLNRSNKSTQYQIIEEFFKIMEL